MLDNFGAPRRRISALQPEHVGDIEHCVAVCARDADLSKVAEDSGALVLRFSTADEVRDSGASLLFFSRMHPEILRSVPIHMPTLFLNRRVSTCWSQAEGWQAAMKQSRAALEALAGDGNAEAALQEWDSTSMASSEAGVVGAADSQKPTMQIRASLGEFAIFVSGRVSEDWWPDDGNRVRMVWHADLNTFLPAGLAEVLPSKQHSC